MAEAGWRIRFLGKRQERKQEARDLVGLSVCESTWPRFSKDQGRSSESDREPGAKTTEEERGAPRMHRICSRDGGLVHSCPGQ